VIILKPITDYKPMNFASWDPSGQGNNIRHLFTSQEREIWDKALPYQDRRNDVGHVEQVVYFAFKLLEYSARAKRDIVIPAAIFHDTGWSSLKPEDLALFKPGSKDFKKHEPRLRYAHQKEGVKIAQRILREVNYPEEYIADIVEIVSQHDTREVFYSTEDDLVRDADKLWRFTLRCWEVYLIGKSPPEEEYDKHKGDIEKQGFFHSDISRHIARIELEQTIRNVRQNI
jgi:hypothetical protein